MPRPEELLNTPRGRNPMNAQAPPMRPPAMGMPPGAPQDMPTAPPEVQPEAGTAPPEAGIPNQATVEKVEGNTVYVKTDQGQNLRIPIDAFLFPPEPGMNLVKAEVVSVKGNVMVIMIAQEQIEVPVVEGFNEGEFIWLPVPPTTPEGLHGSEPVL